MRVDFLGGGFLSVRERLAEDGAGHDGNADPCPDVVGSAVDDAVRNSRGLCGIQEHGEDPHEQGNEDGGPLERTVAADFLLVVLVGELSLQDVAAEAPAVDDEEDGQHDARGREGVSGEAEDEVEQTDAHDGEAVADGHEPDELIEAHDAADGRDKGDGPHEGRPYVTDVSRIEMEH